MNCNKQQVRNIQIINNKFKREELHITRNCIKTIAQIKNTKWKSVRLGQDIANPEQIVDINTDYFDAFLYLISDIERNRTLTPEEIKFPSTIAGRVQKIEQEEYLLS